MRPSKFTATASRRRSTGPDDDTVITILMRSMRDGHTTCEICNVPISGGERGRDWSVQHRVPRGMGGTRSEAVNAVPSLLILCGSGTTGCHGRVESDRAEAYANGWLVSRYSDAATVPVTIDRGSRVVYLGSDGKYHDNPPDGAS